MLLGEGDQFAGYRILRTLGSGGMGEVYLAEHPRLPRRDALKLLRSDISADPEYRGRFEREAALASTLWHPNIVGLHDRGEYDGHLWITMDFVDGSNAADLMSTKYPDGMPTPLVTMIVSSVAGALDYAHKQGLLHRDVKPANIIITNPDDDGQSRVLLADFGIARNIDEVSGLTATNMTVGTVAYAAPEQLMGENVDGRADLYALAATAYHLLTGSQLYPHSNAAVVISRHLNAEPPRLADRRPDLAALDPALAVALNKDPSQRFARATDFARAVNDPSSLNPMHFASAPTQTAPATPRGPASTANQLPPTRPPAHHRTRRAIITAAALLTTTAVAAVIALWHPWSHAPGTASPGVPVAAPANSGPFTGVYAAEFGPEIELGSGKGLNGEPSRATLQVRSTCTPTGCRAIATATDGPTINRSLTFDQIGDQWIAVGTAPSSSPLISKGLNAGCEQGLSPEVWESLALKTQPDGALSGDYEVADANNCNTSRTLTLTRTGDVNTATIDDPTTLPPRKPTPASGFHGQYRYVHAVEGSAPVDIVGAVNTYCLRTIERCMSYFNTISSAEPFVFTDGQWVTHYNAPVHCGSATAPRFTIDRSATLDLPSPATNPINLLSGNGHEQINDSRCTVNHNFDLRFERTGD